jgi:hypothetical protein
MPAVWKEAIAAYLKRNSGVPNAWLAALASPTTLSMSPSSVSRYKVSVTSVVPV